MPSEFQPLVPGAPRGGTSGRVAGAAESAGRFMPLAPGAMPSPSPAAPSARPAAPVVSPIAARPASGASPSGTHAAGDHKPAVTQVIRDGDRITHIEIRCGCGEVITVECGY